MAPPKVQKRKAASKAPKLAGTKSVQFPRVDPLTVGVDPAPLVEYEGAMRTMIRIGGLAGCASVVYKKGAVVQARAWGQADIEAGTPFGFDTYCRLFCMTKTYVAVAFMTLVDEGKASPNDRVDKYLPSFAGVRVRVEGSSKTEKPKRPMLVKHLMSHTSGIGYAPDLGEEPEDPESRSYAKLQAAVNRGSISSLRVFVDSLAKIPLCEHPGTKYNYSFSFDVLGRILEVITGKNLDVCLQERVFGPLGMTDTNWAVPTGELHRLAALYAGPKTCKHLYGSLRGRLPKAPQTELCRIDGHKARDSHWREGQECKVLSGGGFMGYLYGGLMSTVADTSRFVRVLWNYGEMEGGGRLLKKSTVVEMEKNRLKKNEDKVCYLGNIGVYREGADELGMGGAACTYWNIDRKDGTATVWFAQHVDMPEFEDLKGVDPKKADLWAALHRAVVQGAKRKRGGVSTPAAKRQRGSAAKSS